MPGSRDRESRPPGSWLRRSRETWAWVLRGTLAEQAFVVKPPLVGAEKWVVRSPWLSLCFDRRAQRLQKGTPAGSRRNREKSIERRSSRACLQGRNGIRCGSVRGDRCGRGRRGGDYGQCRPGQLGPAGQAEGHR